jgi:hypothetical protein
MTINSQTLPLVEEQAPFQNTLKVFERTKLGSWVQAGSETTIGCAGEGQQQLTRLTSRPIFTRLIIMQL